MKTSPFAVADLQRSVIAVPPLCRNDDLSVNPQQNARVVRHLEAGGVTTLMYGGNANFYNVGVGEYPGILEMLCEIAGAQSWVIPSCGADFGKLIDQARILRRFDFPTAMVLPLAFPVTPAGAAEGIRRFVDAYDKPAIAYIKNDGYLEPAHLARLIDDGIVCAVKYARVLPDPADDAYLDELCRLVDRRLIVSGIGERPVVTHWKKYGLRAFTSGSVCIAPGASTLILRALASDDIDTALRIREDFLPIEDMRDDLSPLCVLHRAVQLAGIADTGPLTPMLSDVVSGASTETLRQICSTLLAREEKWLNAA